MSIRLSEGKAQPQEVTPMPVTPGQPLSADEVGQILARVPELATEPGDQSDFHLAQQPIPPPAAGGDDQGSLPTRGRSRPAGAGGKRARWRCCAFRPKGKSRSRPS